METRVLIVCVNLMTPGKRLRNGLGTGGWRLEAGGKKVHEKRECCDSLTTSRSLARLRSGSFLPPAPSLQPPFNLLHGAP